MLDAYPDSPKCEDNYKNLPLHVAVQNGAAFAVIQMLLEAHPDGVRHNNAGKKQPLALATDDDVKELLAAKKKEIEDREAAEKAAKWKETARRERCVRSYLCKSVSLFSLT